MCDFTMSEAQPTQSGSGTVPETPVTSTDAVRARRVSRGPAGASTSTPTAAPAIRGFPVSAECHPARGRRPNPGALFLSCDAISGKKRARHFEGDSDTGGVSGQPDGKRPKTRAGVVDDEVAETAIPSALRTSTDALATAFQQASLALQTALLQSDLPATITSPIDNEQSAETSQVRSGSSSQKKPRRAHAADGVAHFRGVSSMHAPALSRASGTAQSRNRSRANDSGISSAHGTAGHAAIAETCAETVPFAMAMTAYIGSAQHMGAVPLPANGPRDSALAAVGSQVESHTDVGVLTPTARAPQGHLPSRPPQESDHKLVATTPLRQPTTSTVNSSPPARDTVSAPGARPTGVPMAGPPAPRPPHLAPAGPDSARPPPSSRRSHPLQR